MPDNKPIQAAGDLADCGGPISAYRAKDVFEYRRGFARLLEMLCGSQVVTINIESAAALYKKLVTSAEGYVGEAPIIQAAPGGGLAAIAYGPRAR
jgi:hypothetical protein